MAHPTKYPTSLPLTSYGAIAAYEARKADTARFECPVCRQFFSLKYGTWVQLNDPNKPPEETEPHIVCRDCIKKRRPYVKDWLELTHKDVARLALRCMPALRGRLTLEAIRDWGPEYFYMELFNWDLAFLETPEGEKFLDNLGTRLTAAIYARRIHDHVP